jgi:hypothetical protein
MQRDVRAYLSDIEQAGRDIVDFTDGATLEDYATNKMMRMAVEREFSYWRGHRACEAELSGDYGESRFGANDCRVSQSPCPRL